MGHGHSSPGIEGQGQRSRLDSKSRVERSNTVGLGSILHHGDSSSFQQKADKAKVSCTLCGYKATSIGRQTDLCPVDSVQFASTCC